ncbi:MAG: sulfotransferase domain-containing protein [Gemmatimonadota bacterium]|nr:sulfotransferase domain-containing protein [Gemmatimonadota bacterium]
MSWLWWTLGGVLTFLVTQVVYLGVVLAATDQATNGLGYFGLSPAEREAFRDRLRRHARLLSPILALMSRFSGFTFEKAGFRQDGLPGPRGTCTPESFEAGRAYRPRPEDVFVVTQMKCGTTWMQQLVHQIVTRGRGDLVEEGTTLYAVAPWLEAVKSVSVENAPLLGDDRPSRIIKTHFPAPACPRSDDATYIYVARHPASCFASCADFIAQNTGRLAPPLESVETWFCSEDMWWGPWTDHVAGWWEEAAARENVLFVHFEDMVADFPTVVREVARLLGVDPLHDDEVAEIVRKCSFDYMSGHAGTFEMHPPHLLATDAELFRKGTADRHRDVPDETRRRVAAWCAREMAGRSYPLAERYPDVASV